MSISEKEIERLLAPCKTDFLSAVHFAAEEFERKNSNNSGDMNGVRGHSLLLEFYSRLAMVWSNHPHITIYKESRFKYLSIKAEGEIVLHLKLLKLSSGLMPSIKKKGQKSALLFCRQRKVDEKQMVLPDLMFNLIIGYTVHPDSKEIQNIYIIYPRNEESAFWHYNMETGPQVVEEDRCLHTFK